MPFDNPDFNFDLDNLPPQLRLRDICRDRKRNYAGLVPLTRSAWLDAVEDGYIPPPVKLGPKVIAWPREVVLDIIKNGTCSRRARGRRAEARAAARAEKARAEAVADIKAHERSQRALTNEDEPASPPAVTIPPGGRRSRPRGLKAKAREKKAPPV